jgi:hypothetical protein
VLSGPGGEGRRAGDEAATRKILEKRGLNLDDIDIV